MIYRDITYTDYNGETRTDRFYFNLSRAELLRMHFAGSGEDSLEMQIKRIIETNNNSDIWNMFENIVAQAVGKKSTDGKRFDKSYEAKKDFLESEAYSELIYMLMTGNYNTDPNYASNFVNGLIDQAMLEKSVKKVEEGRQSFEASLNVVNHNS